MGKTIGLVLVGSPEKGCVLGALSFVLVDTEVAFATCANILSADSADRTGDFGEILAAKKLLRFNHNIVAFVFEREHVLQIF